MKLRFTTEIEIWNVNYDNENMCSDLSHWKCVL